MISLLVPSRGRPDSLWKMVTSARETALLEIEVIVRIDQDDAHNYEWNSGLDWVKPLVGPRSTLSSLWNECAEQATGQFLMQGADDIRFRTKDWDEMIVSAFAEYPDGIVYVYGRDGINDRSMATHGVMHRRWYETLGYFTWPEFSSDYGDLWNHTIAERLGRLHFIPELYTEHLHPAVGKAEIDQTHRERLERDKTDRNVDRWGAAQPDLEKAIEKLRSVMG